MTTIGLKPEVSLPVGLATAAIVYAIHSNFTPTIADVRSAAENNETVEASRKAATWTSAAVVAGISLIAKDPAIFIIGGTMVIAMDWFTRHANAVNPATGKAAVRTNLDIVETTGGYVPDTIASMDPGDVYV